MPSDLETSAGSATTGRHSICPSLPVPCSRLPRSRCARSGWTSIFNSLSRIKPGAARRLVTCLARPRKVTERRPPLDSRPLIGGAPVLPASMGRLRNSTWEGTHNVPSHGTRTVLVDFPPSSRAARRASWGTQLRENQSCNYAGPVLPFSCEKSARSGIKTYNCASSRK